jgi:hypothetical protein
LEVQEVHVSVTFTWDKSRGEYLADLWSRAGYDVKIGGPAYDALGEEFVPGRYLAHGNIITSRGCPNKCWFCWVPKREGRVIRELPISDGWLLHDSNLLACSETHIRAVLDQLSKYPQKAAFVGGLEAKILEDWHIKAIKECRAARLYFAYDTPDDLKPLQDAGRRLLEAKFTAHGGHLFAYVLCGYPKDTMESAEKRMWQAIEAGFMPYAMLYRDQRGEYQRTWRHFQGTWVNVRHIRARIRGSKYSPKKFKNRVSLFDLD